RGRFGMATGTNAAPASEKPNRWSVAGGPATATSTPIAGSRRTRDNTWVPTPPVLVASTIVTFMTGRLDALAGARARRRRGRRTTAPPAGWRRSQRPLARPQQPPLPGRRAAPRPPPPTPRRHRAHLLRGRCRTPAALH